MIWVALDRLIDAIGSLTEDKLVEMEIAYSVAAMNRIAQTFTSDMPFTAIVLQRYNEDIRRLSLYASVCRPDGQ